MSRRFGRNQRRKLNAHIAKLETLAENQHNAIADLRAGDWRRAKGEFPSLSKLVYGIGDTEVTEINDYRGKRKEADIRCSLQSGSELYELTYAHTPIVEWEGIVWRIEEADFHLDTFDSHSLYSNRPPRSFVGGPTDARLKMTALAAAAAPKRTYNFGDHPPSRFLEAIGHLLPIKIAHDSRDSIIIDPPMKLNGA